MKYEPGDKIIVMLTNEEGKVVEIEESKNTFLQIKCSYTRRAREPLRPRVS